MTDHSQITEFVGTAIGDTIGLVIPGIDPSLAPFMKLGEYRSIGIFGGRVAVGPQVIAVDEAVKAAWKAFESWKHVTVNERAAILNKIADIPVLYWSQRCIGCKACGRERSGTAAETVRRSLCK